MSLFNSVSCARLHLSATVATELSPVEFADLNRVPDRIDSFEMKAQTWELNDASVEGPGVDKVDSWH